MPTKIALTTMTGPQAYAKAVEYAELAARVVETNPTSQHVTNLAAVSQAFAAIAQAEATARGTAQPGYMPGGGWKRHTHPNEPEFGLS